MKTLTICLPTYNRSNFVIEQLEFLKEDFRNFKDLIEIYVSDNNSDLEHRIALEKYANQNFFFTLTYQEKNCGLIGNMHYLLSQVQTKYVWFVGDDDVLLPNVVERLINILTKNGVLNFIFFNHCGFVDVSSNIVSKLDLIGYADKVINGKECIMNLFKANFTSLMFITACVYNVSVLKHYFDGNDEEKHIEDPLLYSLVCASSGPIYIENEVFVLDRYANATWKSSSSKIFGWGVPNAIIRALNFGFSTKEVRYMLHLYYMRFISSYLRMILSSPFRDKLNIIYFLGTRNMSLIGKSSKFLIQNIFVKNN
ncbi:MAG: glycosyltransferase family 2 protein [Pedobacter sp.]|uniref:glycosyltransferase family 2 protein n=1 Tax=Pedobacter sp. TaxID=1411316 RepID=UPI002806A485|nr:glycosyltransferase family 2 protein [Pedobacter sp.]MDQ8004330.1 glycosyltransferase family 2 protein [Pedobacter sp.]